MKKLLLAIIFLGSLTFSYSAITLQTDLESSYKSYLDAVHTNDAEKLRSTMSSHSYMKLKNIVTSSKMKYPEGFLWLAGQKVINLKKEHFLNAQEKAVTANCIYYGKGFNYSKALLILQFVKEDGKWKFDDLIEKSSDEIITKVESKDYSFLSKDYCPVGNAPSTPKEITAVDYAGSYNLRVEGYKAVLKINGVAQELNANSVLDELVIGGLKKGINYIEVRLVPINQAEKNSIKITIKATMRNQIKEVLSLDTANPSVAFTKEFEIE